MTDYDEVPVLSPGKRLGISWSPWMGDWFTSWSPRNYNNNAEGPWVQWAHLAAAILGHPFTKQVAPELYVPDLPFNPNMYTDTPATLDEATIRAELGIIDAESTKDA